MNFLEKRILEEAVVAPGNVLKVDSFLNHQVDMALVERIGQAFYDLYKGAPITKVLTIETSGIILAGAVARAFGVPLVIAKRTTTKNIHGQVYSAEVLDGDGRINIPGSAKGNWGWRMASGAATEQLAKEIRKLTYTFGRCEA